MPPDKTGGMESYMILDVFLDALMDCLKDLPFLFAAFLLLEFLEQHVSDKMNRTLADTADGLGPLAGSLLGCVPQCGFSIMAAELYAGRVITLGALMAVFLSTSDEALIILLSNPGHVKEVATLIATKIIIGIIAGYAVLGVETVYRRKKKLPGRDISDLDEIFGGHEEEGILKPALLHTAEVALFLFICTFVLNLLMELIGMQTVSKILLRDTVFQPVVAALIGLIPNCGASVILTEFYIDGVISFSSAIAGLCSSAGLGLLVLFRVNKNRKEDLSIVALLFGIAALAGVILQILERIPG